MNSTIPAELLELKSRFETWRTNRLARQVSKRVCSSSNSAGTESTIEYLPKSRLNIDGENIGNTLGNHARLPKQGGQTTACKFDGWLKDWINERLPKGYSRSLTC
jgi:hypothetical protein